MLPAPIDGRYDPERTAERRQAIEAHIRAGGHTKIKRLAREFGVNPTTARRIVRRIRSNGEVQP